MYGNSVDPDQMSLIWVYTVSKSLSVPIFRNIMVYQFIAKAFIRLCSFTAKSGSLVFTYALGWMCIGLVIRRVWVRPPPGRQHSFAEIDHEIFSTVILSLPLIQEGQ